MGLSFSICEGMSITNTSALPSQSPYCVLGLVTHKPSQSYVGNMPLLLSPHHSILSK